MALRTGIKFCFPNNTYVLVLMDEVNSKSIITEWSKDRLRGKISDLVMGWAVDLDQCCAIHLQEIETGPAQGQFPGATFPGRSGI